MLYLFTALYAEAAPVIKRFHLKKDPDSRAFQRFSNGGQTVLLTVTGAGSVPAAAAVSSCFTAFPPERDDLVVSLGICAGRPFVQPSGGTDEAAGLAAAAAKPVPAAGSVWSINRIAEESTGRTFFPDMLYKLPFPETSVLTGSLVLRKTEAAPAESEWPDIPLYDMEAAAVYQAAAFYAGPHQTIFVKIVGDSGVEGRVSRQAVTDVVEAAMTERGLGPALDALAETAVRKPAGAARQAEDRWVSQLERDLCCSQTMLAELRRYVHWMMLEGISPAEWTAPFYEDGRLPCRSRQEGKICFEELKHNI